jgi:hypothetical protein
MQKHQRPSDAGEKRGGNRLTRRHREGLNRATGEHASFDRRRAPGKASVKLGDGA